MNLLEKALDIICVSYVKNRRARQICKSLGAAFSCIFVLFMMILTGNPKFFKDNMLELIFYTLLLFYLPFIVVAAWFFAYNYAKNSPTWFEVNRLYHRYRKRQRMKQEVLAFYQRR